MYPNYGNNGNGGNGNPPYTPPTYDPYGVIPPAQSNYYPPPSAPHSHHHGPYYAPPPSQPYGTACPPTQYDCHTIQPEMIPLPPPLNEHGMVCDVSRGPTMFNNIPYFFHHGSWWRYPHNHQYFSSPSFFNWYSNKWGCNYGGLSSGPHCNVPLSSNGFSQVLNMFMNNGSGHHHHHNYNNHGGHYGYQSNYGHYDSHHHHHHRDEC
ncbi:hypothetical protein MP638_001214 [Amoeboaphelidium occidentale]|nr:hypothetical protein MP638_001214 [Amoeboaphelidium occidentale]